MKKFFIITICFIVIFAIVVGSIICYLFSNEQEIDKNTIEQMKSQLQGVSENYFDIDFESINSLGDISIKFTYIETNLELVMEKRNVIEIQKEGTNENLKMVYKENIDGEIKNLKFYKENMLCYMIENDINREYAETYWAEAIRKHMIMALPFYEIEDEGYLLICSKLLETGLYRATQKGKIMVLYAKDDTSYLEMEFDTFSKKILRYIVQIKENNISKKYTYEISGLPLEINIAN